MVAPRSLCTRAPAFRRAGPLLVGWIGVALALAAASPAIAVQDDLGARELATLVQSFYDRTRTVKAEFQQVYYHELYDRYRRSRGEVVFKKPGRMYWKYEDGRVIVSDGRRLQVFHPGDDDEPPQLFVHRVNEHALPEAFAFLTGKGRLEEEYTFRLIASGDQTPDQGYVLELRPRQPSPRYERLIFYVVVVRADERRAGVVRRVLVIDHAGNRNRFELSSLRFDRPVPSRRFRFRPPPGTRRVHP